MQMTLKFTATLYQSMLNQLLAHRIKAEYDIQVWMEVNELKFNPAKTEILAFGSKTMQDDIKPLLPGRYYRRTISQLM